MAIVQELKIQRQEAILSLLGKLDYLSRSQIQRLNNLGGDRNSRRILSNMSQYIACFRNETGENIYHLNKNGREQIGCEVVRTKTNQVGHYLMRNDLYIHLRPENWRNEMKIQSGAVTVVCDAYFKHQQRIHFLEADHLQHMHKNKEKIERYKMLKNTGTFQEKFKYFPRLVWVTITEARKRQLIEWCGTLDCQVFTWDQIK